MTSAFVRPRRGLWYALAALVVVVTVAVSGTSVVTWLVEQHASHTTPYANSNVRTVKVDAPSASIRVVAGQDGTASVTENLSWVTSKPVVDQTLDPASGTLKIAVRCDSPEKFLGGGGCGAQLDIQVPAAASVLSQSDSGSTTITGLSGSVDVETSSGAIHLNNLSGEVRAQASSGEITGDSLQSAQVSAVAFSGAVSLDFAKPPTQVTAKVTSGAINLSLPRGSQYRITASTYSGGDPAIDQGLAVTSPPSAPSAPGATPAPTSASSGSITATATSGAIDIHYR
ncbi:hypothetical protein ABIA32_001615 [Streptacidiphilus sp. MAP12-20]|uniref:DUF4097 family beta strand repeat-containing protein n=1 Tax=Streptacidiphilus sp. MAP12-20 TaxID=3156299 RepID=UPI003513B0C8